jgi:hypothetical protein
MKELLFGVIAATSAAAAQGYYYGTPYGYAARRKSGGW